MYIYPACTYLLKVNNRNTRSNCEICSKLTVKTTKQRHWRRSGVFIVNFEHISHLVLVFLLLTFNRKLSAAQELFKHICSSFLAVSCFSKKSSIKRSHICLSLKSPVLKILKNFYDIIYGEDVSMGYRRKTLGRMGLKGIFRKNFPKSLSLLLTKVIRKSKYFSIIRETFEYLFSVKFK